MWRVLSLVAVVSLSSGCRESAITGAPDAAGPEVSGDPGGDGGPPACSPGDPSVCDDGNACTSDRCSPQGRCVYELALDVCNVGGVCHDDGARHPDTQCLVCDVAADPGGWTPYSCDDGNPCTADSCDVAAGCLHLPDDAGTCDDGDPCSVDDHCQGGVCVGSCGCQVDADCAGQPGLPACQRWVCADQQCQPTTDFTLNGQACVGADKCLADPVCADGQCVGPARDCSGVGVGPCQTGSCDPDSGACIAEASDEGLACGAATQCAVPRCTGGFCVDDVDTGATCDPGNPCIVGATCDAVGACVGSYDPTLPGCDCDDDTGCDDGQACTVDTCVGGECTFTVSCDDGDLCTDDACGAGGACANPPKVCDDGDLCTIDACEAATGSCLAVPLSCDDGDLCTEDLCDPTDGTCQHPPACEDGNPCTADACDAVTGCEHTKLTGTSCDPGVACIVGTCQSGACIGQPDPLCELYDTAFDCDESGWTLETLRGLVAWRIDGVPAPGWRSAGCSLNFNSDYSGVPNYGAKTGPSTARATSPPIAAPNADTVWLTYWSFWDTQEWPSVGFDRRGIQISTDGFATWDEVRDLNQLPGVNNGIWVLHAVDLSAYAGQTFQLRFWFDTVDAALNLGAGWFVDDLRVRAAPPSVPVEGCDDGFDNDLDGAVDCADPDCRELCALPGEACETAIPLGNVPVTVVGNTDDNQDLTQAPAVCLSSYGDLGWAAPDAVHAFTPAVSANYEVRVAGTGFDPVLYVLTDCAAVADSCAAATAEEPFAQPEVLYLHATAGLTYRIVVDGQLPGESGPYELTVKQAGELNCADGIDNDLDGFTDCVDWPECDWWAPMCNTEWPCHDGVDNDFDGASDCADPDCSDECTEALACNDGVDADDDGLTDCADPDCLDEPVCDDESRCADGLDNDLDGLTDCGDPACAEDNACVEVGTCLDGVDNDGDGLLDCADPECIDEPVCQEVGHCADLADNDGDGSFDCSDPDCFADPSCAETGRCWDGVDNDLDGATDCADSGCASDAVCTVVGSCCGSNAPAAGCDDSALTACVCAFDSTCCTYAWDEWCAGGVYLYGCGDCLAP